MDLMTTFSEIVLTQFRALAKEVIGQTQDELPALAARRDDRFFTAHIRDVLPELQSASLSIQRSFCSELSRNFLAFLHQDGTWTGHECSGGCESQVQALASRLRAADAVVPAAGETVPLRIGPEDIVAAFTHAACSIHLPLHPEVQRCLADLMARKLSERAASIYDQFMLALEHSHCAASGSSPTPADRACGPESPERAAGTQHGDGLHPALSAQAQTGQAMPTAHPAPTRQRGFSAGMRRLVDRLPHVAGSRSSGSTVEPANRGKPSRQAKEGVRGDRLPRAVAKNELFKRMCYAGVVYLMTVLVVFGANRARHGGESSSVDGVARAFPTTTPSSSPQPVTEAAARKPQAPLAIPAGGDERPPQPAPSADGDSPVQGRTGYMRPDTPATAGQSIAVSASLPDLHGDKGLAAPGKVRLRSYDWERKRKDKTVRMWVRIFNGSDATVRSVRLDCSSFSDNLTRLQSFSTSLEQVIMPWTTATVRDLNVGSLHPKTARLRCDVGVIDTLPVADAQ